jgi:hypothetical protein
VKDFLYGKHIKNKTFTYASGWRVTRGASPSCTGATTNNGVFCNKTSKGGVNCNPTKTWDSGACGTDE